MRDCSHTGVSCFIWKFNFIVFLEKTTGCRNRNKRIFIYSSIIYIYYLLDFGVILTEIIVETNAPIEIRQVSMLTVFEIRGNNHCGGVIFQHWLRLGMLKKTRPQCLFPLISNTGWIIISLFWMYLDFSRWMYMKYVCTAWCYLFIYLFITAVFRTSKAICWLSLVCIIRREI